LIIVYDKNDLLSILKVLPIKNQYNCGACYAFAFIALLEFQYAIQLKSSDSLSEQQMVDCSTNDHGCISGYFTQTFSYLQSNLWQVDGEFSYPYKAVSGKCVFKGAGGGGVRFGSLLYNMITVNNANAMEQALVNYGPLWASLFVGDTTTAAHNSIHTLFQSYKSGIFQPSGCPTSVTTTNHAVVIVGYGNDPTTNLPYWKVRNSWGAGWGESGYFRIQRGVSMCGIESGVFYIAKPA
jgi:C1A family cysteine protease